MPKTNNPFMDAVNEHCVSLIDIMAKGEFDFSELRKLQLRFRSFDALLEQALEDIKEDLKETQETVVDNNSKVVSDGI